MAEDGVIPAKYQLTEMPDGGGYRQRNKANVRDSDATLILTTSQELSGGSKQTVSFAKHLRKPWLHVHPEMNWQDAITCWLALASPQVEILNVAGPRSSKEPDIGAFVMKVLDAIAGSFNAPLTAPPCALQNEAQEVFMANTPPCGEIVEFRMSNTDNGLVGSICWFNASDVQAAAEKMIEKYPLMVGLRGAARWASCRESSNPSPSQVPPTLVTFNNLAYDLVQSGKGQVSCPVCCKIYSASELVAGFRKNGGYVYDTFSCPAQHELINVWSMHIMRKRPDD